MVKSKKVDLFIKVTQGFLGKPADSFELFTTGVLKRRKEKWLIEYENEYSGISKISLFDRGFVDILAEGEVCYSMSLNKLKTTKFVCNTKDTFSYFSIKTKDIFFDISENGGIIKLEYMFAIGDGGGVVRSNLNISVK